MKRLEVAAKNGLVRRLRGSIAGENHPNSRLTADAVRAIRLASQQGMSNAAIGRQYGMTKENIRYIVIGQTWRHIQ